MLDGPAMKEPTMTTSDGGVEKDFDAAVTLACSVVERGDLNSHRFQGSPEAVAEFAVEVVRGVRAMLSARDARGEV
jgi:hypothetical protein